jgi:hypothetical protein
MRIIIKKFESNYKEYSSNNIHAFMSACYLMIELIYY